MTPEENLLKKLKEWRDDCKEAHEKTNEYDLGFHLTYMFLDGVIKEYEENTIPEC